MRRTEKEIKDIAIIDEIISKAEICRIALVDGNEPYIVPLNYGYADRILYFHSAPAGRKIELLKLSGRVCFEIEQSSEVIRDDVPCKWTAKYRSVIGFGTLEIVDDYVGKKHGMDIIMRKYGATGQLKYNEELINRMIILKLTIDKVTGKQSGTWD